MKEGWTYKKLGDICRIGIGRTPSRSDMSLWDKNKETQNYWVSIADMGATENGYIEDTKEYISDKAAENIQIIPKGTLLLSFKLTLGKTAIAGTDLYTNEAIANLPFIGNEVNREFLSYYFQFFNWEKFSAGDEKVLGKTLNKKKLDVLPVYYPSIKEQKRIVERLDAAFAQIDELKANAEKQLAEARALFQKSLAKAMEPKEGWEEKKFKELCSFVRGPFGGSLTKSCFVPSGYAVYEQQNAIYNRFTFRYFIDEEKYKSMQRFAVNPGDLIMSCSGTIGKVAIVPDGAAEGIINQALLKLTPKKVLDKYYLKYLMESSIFNDLIAQYSDGAAIKNIASVAILKEIKLNIPPLSEQQRIVERLDSISENVRKYEDIQLKIIAECDALKQALLRQVFE